MKDTQQEDSIAYVLCGLVISVFLFVLAAPICEVWQPNVASPKSSSAGYQSPANRVLVRNHNGAAQQQSSEQDNRYRNKDVGRWVAPSEQPTDYTPYLIFATALLLIPAFWQGWITRKSAQRQLRAYLGIETSSPDPAIKGFVIISAAKISAVVFLKNSGQTPAYQVTNWLEIRIKKWPPSNSDLTEPVDLAGRNKNCGVLNPSQFITLTGEKTPGPTAAEQAAISGGTMAIYVYGRVDYQTAFKPSRYVLFRLAIRQATGQTENFLICDEGNDAN